MGDEVDSFFLAVELVGMNDTYTEEQVEDALIDRFGIDLIGFNLLVEALTEFTIPAQAALTGKVYQGFVQDGAFLYKKEMNSVIH